MRVSILVAAASLWAAAAPLQAQSLFNAAGIGFPMEAVDGRARALGSSGLGLPGTSLLPVDPAASARLLIPGGLMVVQPSWVDLTRDGDSGHRYFRGSRFPVFAAAYPVRGGMATVHLTSVLDQAYTGERIVNVNLGSSTTQATDRFEQAGAVSSLGIGYSRMVASTMAVGISAGRYAGSVSRTLTREFGDSALANQVLPYRAGGSWSYSGYQVTVGVSSDVTAFLRLAASATYSTELDADPSAQTAGSRRSFDMPLQLRLGASSQLAPGLTLAASASRADWSGTEGDLLSGEAGAATSVGLGLELAQAQLFGRTTPLRAGFRRRTLPFALEGGGANEQTFSGGLGIPLNVTSEIVLASLDLGLEKGNRTSGSFREDFWRGTVSLRVTGF
ncbi:MAG: hypothetical protein FJ207_13535 [Gemmatimonadetes bacterium]|nr:hypothetical protein [Gemmatimonadota bacterium]